MQTHAIVSSETPAWKNPPAKLVRVITVVCFKKPSVLSELQRSAELTIMLGTYSESRDKQAEEPFLVGEFGFCFKLSQGMFGNLLLSQSLSCAAFSGLLSAQLFSS